jgi:glycosyltransferase involved in cell wall biosynthesis
MEFLGSLTYETLLQEMAEADVFLHPSLEESFGMVVAEAMALGLPVVGGKASGAVPWVIGRAGILVDVTNPTEIAHGLIDLLSNPEKWQVFRNLARTTSISRFSVESVVDAYEKIYTQQLSRY